MQDEFIICQIPCYTEGEDSLRLRRTTDSLVSLFHDVSLYIEGGLKTYFQDLLSPHISYLQPDLGMLSSFKMLQTTTFDDQS